MRFYFTSNMKKESLAIILLITLSLMSCFFYVKIDSSEKLTHKITLPNGREILVEIAQTLEDRVRGLMYRKNLPYDRGMFFIFLEEDFHSFWMKNTSISLDIIWLDSNYKIVYFYTNVPPCTIEPCDSYFPIARAKYVLEVNAGLVKKEGLKISDLLILKKVQK
jgi:uncharacterized membrane protein (UPF0127 family)